MSKSNDIAMHKAYRITEIADEAKDVKTFFLDSHLKAKPGQFVKVWIPGMNERPFSVSYSNGITVKRIGGFTSALFDLQANDKLWIRGPYGNSFLDFAGNGKKYIIAGGIGAAPLGFLSEHLNNATALLGAKSKDELVFEKRFKSVLVSTDDGSHGMKGFATDLLGNMEIESSAQFFICGPEKMMLSAAKKAMHHVKAENIILSLERYMKCGVGLCGSCEFSGLRVCTDGPVFSYDKLLDSEFGRQKRDRTGKMVEL